MKRFFAMLLFLSITFLGGCTQTATKISENSDETIQPSVELSFSDDMLSHNNNASMQSAMIGWKLKFISSV